jgi:hypothetical protein
MQRWTPVKGAIDSGALVVPGSDWAVVPSVNPWIAIETLVTRLPPGVKAGEPLGAAERITLEQALQLFTVNLIGARGEPYSFPISRFLWATVKLAFTGRFGKELLEAVYADQPEARKKSICWARLMLLFHAALIVVSVAFRLWPLPLLVSFAPFIANWLRYFVGVPMHTGLRDNVADFRLCVRTITLDPISQFLYWRMNWHLEHHMFAAVPCYNLQALHRAVAADMPKPRTLLGAWREMRQTWKRQQTEPGYQFETPLPGRKAEGGAKPDSLESSLGDLAPKDLE